MSVRRWNRLAFLHKIEAVYGTDIGPSAADAIIASNITFTPLQANEEMRDRLLPYMGNQGAILTEEHGRIEFDVEIAGAGAAGSVPKYGSLLRVCGLAETVTAGTDVTYSIVEDGVESGTIYFNSDGTQHVFVGGQANVQPGFTAKRIPKFRFTLTGLLGSVTDVALPSVTDAGWVTPVAVSKANTTMSLHGWDAVAQSLSLNLGNTLTPRFQIGEESVRITDRKSTGTAVVDAKSMATKNWFAIARARTRGALSIQHGTSAGNIVEIAAPAVEIGAPSQGQENNVVNYSLPLALCPNTGLDEMTITVR
ncbi:MAG: phage tail tube protein [Rhodobacteraceae bacterium]|nr:phage tail tube protein [Paracoccaceae bacterium]